MFRVLLTLSLIVSLTACPFRCMGRTVLVAGSAPVERHCCEHCRNAAASGDDRQSPEPTESDSGCCDCVCTGAVLVADTPDDHLTADVNFLATAALITEVLTSAEFCGILTVHPPPSSEPSGSALKFALQSLLI